MKNQKTKFVILGLLTIRPMSGYDITKYIRSSIGHFWSESNGQIYPTLNQLTKETLVQLEGKQQKGKKVSYIYSITNEGRTVLHKWLEETIERKHIRRDEELLKLFFGTNVSFDTSIKLLAQRAKGVQEKLEHFLEIQKGIEEKNTSSHSLYWLLSLKNGIAVCEAELKWCHDSIRVLKTQEQS